MSVRFDFATL